MELERPHPLPLPLYKKNHVEKGIPSFAGRAIGRTIVPARRINCFDNCAGPAILEQNRSVNSESDC